MLLTIQDETMVLSKLCTQIVQKIKIEANIHAHDKTVFWESFKM